MLHRVNLYCFLLWAFATSCFAQSSYKTSPAIARNLIDVCIEVTLKLDPGLNSRDGHYQVDFNKIPELHQTGISSFLKSNALAQRTNLDSLFKHDKQWLKEQYFNHPVIRFDEVKELPGGKLMVKTSKFAASDGAIGTEIILYFNGDHFTVISSGITWIS